MDRVEQPLKLHVIPYLSDGHMIPLCDIAILFASRGHQVTIITTPSNVKTFQKSLPSHLHQYLHIHTIPFPSQEVGLPEGVENLSGIPDMDKLSRYTQAMTLLQPLIEEVVEHDPPDCIVADFMYPWVEELANKLRIPRLAFTCFSLFAICAMKSVMASSIHGGSGSFLIQGLPHPIRLNATPPMTLREGNMKEILDIQLKSHGLIVNNFSELDGEEYTEYYEKTINHKAWHIGPAYLIRKTAQEKAERGQGSTVSVHECMSWLNSKRDNSVLYISFGTISYLPNKQLYEIASALEACGHEFIWVVPEKKGKEDESEEEKENWLPKGFEERCIGKNKKGLLVKGWAPQLLILEHSAICAFLTHCGWNSIVEAAAAGVPMITWPVHGEQFYNEKLVTQVRGIGVEVGATEWSILGIFDRESVVRRESIEKAVRRLLDGGDEAKKIKQRAREFGDKAKRAAQEGGSSHRNLTALIEDLKRLRDNKF
uniref:Glycosyltransferase n=1 Tax=Astragalus mongholicus TaxID=119829 RepID=A0A977WLP2_ASTMO|nr:O-glycosyltransferase [Astragalus mongholicus]